MDLSRNSYHTKYVILKHRRNKSGFILFIIGGSGGDLYTRWGRSNCTGPNTELVYSGKLWGCIVCF